MASHALDVRAGAQSLGRSAMPQSRGVRRSLPLIVLISWWFVCYASYVLGWPIEYDRTNFGSVAWLFGSCALLTVLGFHAGLRFSVRWNGPGMAWWPAAGLFITVALFFPSVSTYSALGLADIGTAITDQGAAYQETSRLFEAGITGGAVVFVAALVTSMLTITAVPYYASKTFGGSVRAGGLLFLAIIPPLSMSILTGRDQQLGMVLLVVGGVGLVALARNLEWSLGKASITAALIAVLTFFVMSYRRYQRLSGVELCSPGQINCDENASGFLSASIRTFASYGTQGFEGLGRALEAEWGFGGGFSHSIAINGLYSRFVDVGDVSVVTDQLDLLGWSSTANWSTALPQLANDLPWALVPVFFGAWATLLGLTWKLAISEGDWLTVTLFSFTMYGFIFVPQNFQLGLTAQVYAGYLFLIVLLATLLLVHRRPGVVST